MLTLAILDWEVGRGDEAQRKLERCLQLAAPEGVFLPFIDNADTSCVELLAAHAATTAHREFVDRCIEVCDATAARRSPAAESSLTPRELEVLAYLRTPMTGNEIAARLSVSLNTLKTHQRAIYRKLGVTNRREAVRATHR
jgi:LuxR family maltose regulon positive regulatory protein